MIESFDRETDFIYGADDDKSDSPSARSASMSATMQCADCILSSAAGADIIVAAHIGSYRQEQGTQTRTTTVRTRAYKLQTNSAEQDKAKSKKVKKRERELMRDLNLEFARFFIRI